MLPISSCSQPYPISSSFNTNEFDTGVEMRINEYQSKQGYRRNPHIDDLYRAIFPIHGSDGSFIGNCFAIAQDFLLTCRHCLEGEIEIRGIFGPIEVIFDGARYNLDFAVLWVEGGQFQPVTLDLDNAVGEAVQMYHKLEGPSLNIYVKPFTSQTVTAPGGGSLAMRGDFASSKTNPGESGAPRMLLRNGYVHAMHQGNSEGLTMNAFYAVLEQAQKDGHPNAGKILLNINAEHIETRGLNWSPLTTKIGDVEEEKNSKPKPRINESVKLRDPNNPRIVATFNYTEIGEGRGNRAIRISKDGVASSQITYAIYPNPHDNHHYNNKGQKKFYETLAKEIGKYYLLNVTHLTKGTIEVFNEDYILSKVN
ncbi:serine protease [Candidatus Protochlamydia sp. W-9]|uniref:serine protease n=1 Tax=Candidatus Protochlamydia sp. W-9 TaxID=1785087 RepID=UPI00096A4D55|nr:serine protease [Candidatus Protochlamydia sp. W-9]